MESVNLLVDMKSSIVQFKIRVLEDTLRVLYPNKRIFVKKTLLNSKISQLIQLMKGHSFVCIGRTVK